MGDERKGVATTMYSVKNFKSLKVLVFVIFLFNRSSTGKIHVTLVEARDLAKSDMIGKSDPYAVLSHGNQKFRTNTAKNTQNPKWNYDADFNVPDQADDRIRVDIYDSDKIGKDKPLGSAFFDVEDVMARGVLPPGWYPLKGAKSGEVLMSADFEALNSSRLGSPDRESITGNNNSSNNNNNLNRLGSSDQLLGDRKGRGADDKPGPLDGILHVELMGARNLVKSDLIGKSDPYARLQLGDEVYTTEIVKNSQNPEWNFGTDFTVDSRTIGDDVRINVLDHDKLGKDKSLGTLGLPVEQLLADGQDPNFNRWYPLAGVKSGEVLIASHFLPFDPEAYHRRMSGHGLGSRQPSRQGDGGDGQRPGAKVSHGKEAGGAAGLAAGLKKRSSTDRLLDSGADYDLPKGNVLVRLTQARNLPKTDLLGKGDPYAVISCGAETSKTPVIKDSQNPVWNHEAVFSVDPATDSTIDIRLMDSDRLGADKPVGQLRLDLGELVEEGPIVDQWLPLDKAKSGEVQLTVEFIPEGEEEGDRLDGGRLAGKPSILKPGGQGGGARHLRDKLGREGGAARDEDELIPGTLHLGMQNLCHLDFCCC
jgi:hypothetical protein